MSRAALTAHVFDRPFAQTRPRRITVPEGATIAAMVESGIGDPVLRAHAVVWLQGECVPRASWARIRPKPAAVVSIGIRPSGGDSGGAKLIRTVLQVAVVALATWVGGGAGGAIASSLWAAAAASTIMVVGNLAINALVPPPQPSLETNARPDATYSIEGARNELVPYGVVPLPMGRIRVFPRMQGQPWQETVGDDVYLRLLFSLGPMEYADPDPDLIRIGETRAIDFEGVEIETRVRPTDPPLTLYTTDPSTEVVGAHLTTGLWVTRTGQPGMTEAVIILAFPTGLGGKDKKGKNVSVTVTLDVQYQPVSEDPDTGPWYDARSSAPQANQAVAALGETRFGFGGLFGDYDTRVRGFGAPTGTVTYRRAEPGKPFRREIRVALPEGQYRFRIRRTNAEADDDRTADRVDFAQLISFAPTDPNPEPMHAEMAMRIKASDQLSGMVDTINLVLERVAPRLDPAIAGDEDADLSAVTADDWTEAAVTRSPADLGLFAVRGPHVANPRPDALIDWPAWAAFSRWCADQGYTFDYFLVEDMRRADWLRLICAAGRGRPVILNNLLSVVIDAPRASGPSAMITARNVRGFRMTKTFPGDVHALRVTFQNEQEDYRTDERIVYMDGYSKDGSEPGTQEATKFEALELIGVTDPDLIYRLARFHGATALLQTERFHFTQDVESLTCTYGDLVAIQHDVMVLGLGAGRVQSLILEDGTGRVAGVVLDETVEMTAGVQYGLTWRRVVDDEDDHAHVELEASRPVQTEPGAVQTLLFADSMAADEAPSVGDLLAFGELGQETVPALVRNIDPAPGLEADIECVLEAGARFLAEDGPVPSWGSAIVTQIRRRPPTPELVAVNVSAAGIFVRFGVPTGFEDRIARVEAAWRVTPAADGEAAWTALSPLGAEDRVLSFVPPSPLEDYDFKIVLIDAEARRSEAPLLVTSISADDQLDPPQGVFANAVTIETANGVRQPVLQVSAEADDDLTLTDLVVEIRPSSSEDEADFNPLAILPPDRPTRDIRDVPPGSTVDVAFRYRALRGEGYVFSPRVLVEDVVIPDELTSIDATIPSAAIEAAKGAINDALGRVDETLADSAGALALTSAMSGQHSLLNWLQDPLFEAGSDGFRVVEGVQMLADGPQRAIQASWTLSATGAQTTRVIWWPGRKPVREGVFVQASCDIAVLGAASSARVEAVWYDAAGETLSASELGAGSSGRIGGVAEAPEEAAFVEIRVVPVAGSADIGGLVLSRPLAAYALPGQIAPSPFQPPDNELAAEIAELRRTVGAMAEFIRSLQAETRQGRAGYRENVTALVTESEARAEAVAGVYAVLEGQYLTQAAASQSYLALANLEESIAGIDLTANAAFEALATTVNGLPEDVLSEASAEATFVSKAGLEQAVAGISFSGNAEWQDLTAAFDILVGAVADVEDQAAYFEVLVEGAGGNNSQVRLFAGKDGSAVDLVSDRIALRNPVDGAVTDALVASGGNIFIPNQLIIDDGGRLLIQGPGNAEMNFGNWLGGTKWGLNVYDGSKELVLLDPVSGIFLIDGVTLKDATVAGSGLAVGAAVKQWIAADAPSNWYITATSQKLASFVVSGDTAEAALQIDAQIDVYNLHDADVHIGALIQVDGGAGGTRTFYRIMGQTVTETLAGGMTTQQLSAGSHTIDLWVVYYGARSGTPDNTDIRVENYEVRAALVERAAVTQLSTATQPNTTGGGGGGGGPGGGWNPPPGAALP
ncbi:TipJ family phage tail tip protein [Marinicauda sp. Alg238-R41]|uniref:TipJ family phage tail tip protein n=1 Tax=Marinicauda sp. Alg238-R41 TaxID=2993447 RepID=UPI0022E8B787|nr:phage tail protein [Marinicauda sp. Alg238-R41]